MELKRILLLVGVVLASLVLKDIVLPRECLEEWIDQCLDAASHLARRHGLF